MGILDLEPIQLQSAILLTAEAHGQRWIVMSPMVSAGQKIMWKGNLTPKGQYDDGYFDGIGKFRSTGSFNVEGNIMSLLYGDSFEGKKSLAGFDFAFTTLFVWCKRLVNAEKLLLPATTLSKSCYQEMFKSPSLITVPKLPATTLARQCYETMFDGCSSLTTAPELPATTLAYDCYGFMFSGCSSLKTAPELPATALAEHCYHNMFEGCTSLTTAPVLSAISLANYCYYEMFLGCTSLNYIKCLATDVSATDCTTNWVKNVSSSGTFVKNSSMSGWSRGESGIPSGWTVQNE